MSRAAAVLGILVSAALFGPLFQRALAEDPPASAQATAQPSTHQRCQVFLVNAAAGVSTQTDDQTTEVGQWVAAQAGWQVHDVDFEVGQKGTGYPQAYLNVCLRPKA